MAIFLISHFLIKRTTKEERKYLMKLPCHTLGIDIGSTTVKIAILTPEGEIIFSDYQRHYANIQETLASIIKQAL